MNEIILCSKVSIYDKELDETIIYGRSKNIFSNVIIENLSFSFHFCQEKYDTGSDKFRKEFFLKIKGYIKTINNIIFCFSSKNLNLEKLDVLYPFENCDINLNTNSAIITTMCKDYEFRLDEWIEYNLKLGFSGIIIFDNKENNSNNLNESINNCSTELTMNSLLQKYKSKVWFVDFPYKPLPGDKWNSLQSISLCIGVTNFRKNCKNIALIDADEFIHMPNENNIETFLSNYKTISMKSNILTNKNTNDLIDNNILDICLYVGENKYPKIILDTSTLKEYEFIFNPHQHPSQFFIDKNLIIHYHCWVNTRYNYNINMKEIDFLKQFKYNNI